MRWGLGSGFGSSLQGAYADRVPFLVVAKGTVTLLRKVWESLLKSQVGDPLTKQRP